jgi:hypothetical protein
VKIEALQITEVLVETETLEQAAERVAAYVNRQFERWLSQQPLVYSDGLSDSEVGMIWEEGQPADFDMLQARLVDIKEADCAEKTKARPKRHTAVRGQQ